MIKKTAIRYYLQNLLIAEAGFGDKVFIKRINTPLVLEDTPNINIHFGAETRIVSEGSKYFPKCYECELACALTIVSDNQLYDETDDIAKTQNQNAMDFVDQKGVEIEQLFQHDWRFARRLPTFDANTNYFGLIDGYTLEDINTYDIEAANQVTYVGQTLRFVLRYMSKAYLDYRLPELKEIYAAIMRVGYTNETVDPVLLAFLENI